MIEVGSKIRFERNKQTYEGEVIKITKKCYYVDIEQWRVRVKKKNAVEIENIKESETITIKNMDGLEYLKQIDNNSINLVLTDPPYIISKETGMGNLHKQIKNNNENNIEFVKTEKEWNQYKKKKKNRK